MENAQGIASLVKFIIDQNIWVPPPESQDNITISCNLKEWFNMASNKLKFTWSISNSKVFLFLTVIFRNFVN